MDPMILILIFGGFFAVLLLVVGLLQTAKSEHSLVEERLGKYFDDPKKAKLSGKPKSSPVGDWLDKKIEKSNVGGGISRELARADIKLKAGEYFIIVVLTAFVTAFLFWFLMDQGNTIPIFTLIGFIVGLNLPKIYLKIQQSKRLQKFDNQLSDMLNLTVNGLRAGYSNMQAIESVSREMPAPIADEFKRVVQEMQLGLTMDMALANLLRRIPSPDLDLVITAMNVQREVGGNLAEILETISYTIRERVRIKGEIRVLTSQVIYSGRFLAMMPLIISGILWMVNRPYMMQFFNPETRIIGIIALVIAGLMIIGGYFTMTRIANIEV